MKLITIILLINWLLCNTINAQTCRDPIVILNQKIPQTIDFVKLGFGKGLNSDKTIIIVGTPTNQTDQFAINLAEEGELFKTANVPFHFNPRFGYEQVVVRNSWNKTSGWGTEERSGGFPFAIGQTFVLKLSIISARIPGISININNKFFVSYRRYRFYDITQLNIVGAIQLSSITLCNPPLPRPPCLFQYVFANPEIPVNYNFLTIGSNFGTGFLPPKKITIIGTPTNNTYEPNDFVINMGENGIMLNNATVVFSYNPRFDVNQVIIKLIN
ncbi:hypothetical protein Mgra_00004739 [Meloidogyne graminicola]|uniref:Galectin n=1 Tax=Meloidogyne graminicola TaxID=189291 RepID=A0A8S9ZQD4_9BILA|nr:hypothetical protein Mgra_00004739 [Meloidogyne graminicola]